MARGKFEEWLTEDGQLQLVTWGEDGLTDREIAKAIGVAESTLYDWKRKHPEISEAIKRGRVGALVQIRNALRERAKGGIVTVKKPMKMKCREYDPETGKCILDKDVIEYVEEEVYIPPDTGSLKFYLTNRDAEHWTEKVEVAGSGELRLEELLPDG